MITAIDFGCHTIRSAFREPSSSPQITLFTERSEYAVLPDQDAFRHALQERQISYAECDESLVVFGNRAADVRWLSRKPCAPLFTDGGIPTSDAPARQILHVLTKAILPEAEGTGDFCCFTVPGKHGASASADFLTRLIRMQGFTPVPVSSSESLILASGAETSFTGISVVIGAETSEVGVSRYGMQLASETIDVGANWIDTQIAGQFKLHVWDAAGECYLDLEAVREWKSDSRIHLRNGIREKEKTLARLYGAVLDRIAKSASQLLQRDSVKTALAGRRLTVICAGGPTQISGFSSALTERFVDHDIASDILAVRISEDPATTVVRGLLIRGELEQRQFISERSAA